MHFKLIIDQSGGNVRASKVDSDTVHQGVSFTVYFLSLL